eukprot:6210839-Pleurochrysis_carterae.AAC.2
MRSGHMLLGDDSAIMCFRIQGWSIVRAARTWSDGAVEEEEVDAEAALAGGVGCDAGRGGNARLNRSANRVKTRETSEGGQEIDNKARNEVRVRVVVRVLG